MVQSVWRELKEPRDFASLNRLKKLRSVVGFKGDVMVLDVSAQLDVNVLGSDYSDQIFATMPNGASRASSWSCAGTMPTLANARWRCPCRIRTRKRWCSC